MPMNQLVAATINIFEVAIKSNEINYFFRGERRYHVSGSDYEGQLASLYKTKKS